MRSCPVLVCSGSLLGDLAFMYMGTKYVSMSLSVTIIPPNTMQLIEGSNRLGQAQLRSEVCVT